MLPLRPVLPRWPRLPWGAPRVQSQLWALWQGIARRITTEGHGIDADRVMVRI